MLTVNTAQLRAAKTPSFSTSASDNGAKLRLWGDIGYGCHRGLGISSAIANSSWNVLSHL
jgi:hypothetical protein